MARKKKPTVRREIKRIENKSMREAEKASLRGDRPRKVNTEPWNRKDDRQPFPEENSVRGKKAKKKKVEYCPARKGEGANKRHYYIDTESEKVMVIFTFTSGMERVRRKVAGKRCMYCGKSAGIRARRWKW